MINDPVKRSISPETKWCLYCIAMSGHHPDHVSGSGGLVGDIDPLPRFISNVDHRRNTVCLSIRLSLFVSVCL